MQELYDIVYVLKQDVKSDELKYSIRTVVQNFKYNRIIFYCGCPEDIKPDIHVPFVQVGIGKINKVINTLKAIVNDENITENFWLFNDDFFIMKPFEETRPICNGTLYSVIKMIESSKNKTTRYTKILRDTAIQLNELGFDTISYAAHAPMLINRKKAKEVLYKFESPFSFRSAYGNYWGIEGILRPDVKISTEHQEVNESLDLLSSNDTSFSKGKIGEFIRNTFTTPSKYEL